MIKSVYDLVNRETIKCNSFDEPLIYEVEQDAEHLEEDPLKVIEGHLEDSPRNNSVADVESVVVDDYISLSDDSSSSSVTFVKYTCSKSVRRNKRIKTKSISNQINNNVVSTSNINNKTNKKRGVRLKKQNVSKKSAKFYSSCNSSQLLEINNGQGNKIMSNGSITDTCKDLQNEILKNNECNTSKPNSENIKLDWLFSYNNGSIIISPKKNVTNKINFCESSVTNTLQSTNDWCVNGSKVHCNKSSKNNDRVVKSNRVSRHSKNNNTSVKIFNKTETNVLPVKDALNYDKTEVSSNELLSCSKGNAASVKLPIKKEIRNKRKTRNPSPIDTLNNNKIETLSSSKSPASLHSTNEEKLLNETPLDSVGGLSNQTYITDIPVKEILMSTWKIVIDKCDESKTKQCDCRLAYEASNINRNENENIVFKKCYNYKSINPCCEVRQKILGHIYNVIDTQKPKRKRRRKKQKYKQDSTSDSDM